MARPLQMLSMSRFLKERAKREEESSKSWPVLPDWRGCSVYRHASEYVVIASNRLDSGVIQSCEPIFVLPGDATDTELGQAILDALAASKSGVPHVGRLSGVAPEWLKSAGFTSWKALAAGSRCVKVERTGDQMSLTPMQGLPGGSMCELVDKLIHIVDWSSHAVGGRVRAAISNSIASGVAKARRAKRRE